MDQYLVKQVGGAVLSPLYNTLESAVARAEQQARLGSVVEVFKAVIRVRPGVPITEELK